MLKKQELERMAERYQLKADRAYANYQETGAARYDRENKNNEDLADALRMAAAAAEDHERLVALRAEVVSIASRADKAVTGTASAEEKDGILKSIVSDAAVMCGYKRIEQVETAAREEAEA